MNTPEEQYRQLAENLERKKREGLEMAIDEGLPRLAKADMDKGTEFARQVLEDIQEGNNPDLEERFRAKIEELGIQLNG